MKFFCLIFAGSLLLGTIILGCAHFMPRPESESRSGSSSNHFASIEDAEDGDDQIKLGTGRNGYIYTYADEAGSVIEPGSNNFKAAKGGAAGSEFALRFKGTTSKSGAVYAGMGFSFTEPIGPYNASRCQGVAFIAKKGPGSTDSIKVKLPDVNTDPAGGVCKECYNDFGISLKVTEEWTRYVVHFLDLKQETGWGDPNPKHIDTTKLYGMQWQTAAPGAEFDIWIDDVEFVECGEK